MIQIVLKHFYSAIHNTAVKLAKNNCNFQLMAKQKYQTNKEKIQKRLQIIFFYSRHFHKINVKTYNHQVRINYHTWEVK